MIVDKVLDYIKKCPYFTEDDIIATDYLSQEATSYSLETSPVETILKTYVDGSSERQLDFYVTGREVAGAFAEGNVENNIFYEKFSKWIEENNRKKILPILEEPLEAISIEVLSSPYVIQVDIDRARYVIHMNFKYYCNE